MVHSFFLKLLTQSGNKLLLINYLCVLKTLKLIHCVIMSKINKDFVKVLNFFGLTVSKFF